MDLARSLASTSAQLRIQDAQEHRRLRVLVRYRLCFLSSPNADKYHAPEINLLSAKYRASQAISLGLHFGHYATRRPLHSESVAISPSPSIPPPRAFGHSDGGSAQSSKPMRNLSSHHQLIIAEQPDNGVGGWRTPSHRRRISTEHQETGSER